MPGFSAAQAARFGLFVLNDYIYKIPDSTVVRLLYCM